MQLANSDSHEEWPFQPKCVICYVYTMVWQYLLIRHYVQLAPNLDPEPAYDSKNFIESLQLFAESCWQTADRQIEAKYNCFGEVTSQPIQQSYTVIYLTDDILYVCVFYSHFTVATAFFWFTNKWIGY